MTSEHEAIAAVAAAIQPEIFNAFARTCDWLDHEVGPEARLFAIKAIAAYQHYLATRSSDAVVLAVDEFEVAVENRYWAMREGSAVHEYEADGPYQAARTRLLALIAEHALRSVVTEPTMKMIYAGMGELLLIRSDVTPTAEVARRVIAKALEAESDQSLTAEQVLTAALATPVAQEEST